LTPRHGEKQLTLTSRACPDEERIPVYRHFPNPQRDPGLRRR
jgi:hypothetical protein